ncbi:MAG: lysophospholipid acyltransferase family protein [Bryobacterales bacterium]|nr:lysophospholipid acyltransferase family protein [Bryobacterales bacterium]
MPRRSTARDAAEYAAVRLLLAVLEWLPVPIAELVARTGLRVLGRLVPRLDRVALQNLQLALPELGPIAHRRILAGMYRSLARALVVFARFPRLDRTNIGRWIRCEGEEHVRAAFERGRGILFATGHLGNWELSAFAYALLREPMNVVVRPLDNPKLDALVAKRRTLSGNRLIEKREAARQILKALAANQAVGILVDQNSSPDEGVFVDFFGIRACASAGLARLAARSGAAVIPGYALWSDQEKRYVLRFEPPVEITGDTGQDTQRVHKRLESVIRRHPEQWLWIHRRWKTRPPGELPIY